MSTLTQNGKAAIPVVAAAAAAESATVAEQVRKADGTVTLGNRTFPLYRTTTVVQIPRKASPTGKAIKGTRTFFATEATVAKSADAVVDGKATHLEWEDSTTTVTFPVALMGAAMVTADGTVRNPDGILTVELFGQTVKPHIVKHTVDATAADATPRYVYKSAEESERSQMMADGIRRSVKVTFSSTGKSAHLSVKVR